MNAYDVSDPSGDRVILDVVRHPRVFTTGPRLFEPTSLDRWTVDLTSGRVSTQRLDDHLQEFPRVDERRVGRRHRFGYSVHSVATPEGSEPRAILRLSAFAAMPALYPIIFSTIPLGPAIATALFVSVLPLTFDIAASGITAPHFPLAVAMTLIGVVTAPIIGIVIVGAVRQRIRLAGLVRELSASRAETSRPSKEAGVAAERERLAREIHDTLAQGFTSIVALAQAVEAERETDGAAAARHIALIESTARENLAEARTMVTRLTPTALDGAMLSDAIRHVCQTFSADTGIEIDLAVDEGVPSRGMATDVMLLRVAQEALTNIRRHASASRVRVELRSDRDALRLSMSDNGVGLDAQHADGFGLRGVRARVAQVGGRVSISSPTGAGTTVNVEVPS